jgi:hypothetical protein
MSKTESAGTTAVKLSPTAGFCIKTTTLEPGFLPPAAVQGSGAFKGALKDAGLPPMNTGAYLPLQSARPVDQVVDTQVRNLMVVC